MRRETFWKSHSDKNGELLSHGLGLYIVQVSGSGCPFAWAGFWSFGIGPVAVQCWSLLALSSIACGRWVGCVFPASAFAFMITTCCPAWLAVGVCLQFHGSPASSPSVLCLAFVSILLIFHLGLVVEGLVCLQWALIFAHRGRSAFGGH